MKLASVTTAILSIGCAFVRAQETPTPTPSPTQQCLDVSVEGDATFCVEGPVCSGGGAQPAGWNCPKTGDVAKADCWDYVPSYADAEGCVAPVDATCQMMGNGAWGCVWDTGSGSMDGSAGSWSGSGSGSGTIMFPVNASAEAENPEDIQFPSPNLKANNLAAKGSSSSDSSSTGTVVIAVVAIAGVACVVAAAMFLRRKQQRRDDVAEIPETAYAGSTPLTPPRSKPLV